MPRCWRHGGSNFKGNSGSSAPISLPDAIFPGKSRVSVIPLSTVSIVTLDGKLDQIDIKPDGIRDDGSDALALAINRGPQALRFMQSGREVEVESGQPALFGNGMVGHFAYDRPVALSIFRLPR